MSLAINGNSSGLLLQSLNKSQAGIAQSAQRLSTGFSINSASDDAAGLILSELLNNEARQADIASQNAQSSMNMMSVAESDLSAINSSLGRVRELALQASNPLYSDTERAAIQAEIDARVGEIDQIAGSSSFNEINLLNGDSAGMEIPVDEASVVVDEAFASADAAALGLSSVDVSSADAARALVDEVDAAMENVSDRRSELGSISNTLSSSVDNLSVKRQNLEASGSRIRDVDVAKEMLELSKNQMLGEVSLTLLASVNQSQGTVMNLLK